jgi:hypothetical protein
MHENSSSPGGQTDRQDYSRHDGTRHEAAQGEHRLAASKAMSRQSASIGYFRFPDTENKSPVAIVDIEATVLSRAGLSRKAATSCTAPKSFPAAAGLATLSACAGNRQSQ